MKTGTTLPPVCSTGEVFFKLDAANSQNLYGCTSTNTWSLLSGSGAAALLLSGDLSGRTDAARVDRVQGVLVKATPASDGQVMTWSQAGNQWQPWTVTAPAIGAAAAVHSHALTDLLGITSKHGPAGSLQAFGGGTTNTNECAKFDASGNLVSAGAGCNSELPSIAGSSGKVLSSDGSAVQWRGLGGDLSGPVDGASVNKIQGQAIQATAAADGQVMTWVQSATKWQPSTVTPSGIGAAPTAHSHNLTDLAGIASKHGSSGSLQTFGGGIVNANDCAKFDVDGSLISSGSACGATTGLANYSYSFAGQTSVTLAHNANTKAILVQCRNASDDVIYPNSITFTDANNATVTFGASQSGTCVVNASGGGSAGVTSFSGLTGVASIAQGGTGQFTKSAAFNALSPNASKGDLTGFDGTNNVRMAVGADNNCLIADSTQLTGMKWGPCAGISPGAGMVIAGGVAAVDPAVIPTFLTGAASLSFPAIASGRSNDQSFTLNGASTGDAVICGLPNTVEAGITCNAFVSAPNTITIRLLNATSSSVTPAGGQTFRATIVRSL